MFKTGRRARIWGKKQIEKESDVIGDGTPGNILAGDFIVPSESAYGSLPPSNVRINLKSLDLAAPTASLQPTPATEVATPFSSATDRTQEIMTYPASISFLVTHGEADEELERKISLTNDVNFVTAHPCTSSSKVKLYRSPASPTIRGIDVRGFNETVAASASSTSSFITGNH